MDKNKVIKETKAHISEVRNLLTRIINGLRTRGENHDKSKLEEPELPIFVEFTPKLKGLTYGKDEYKKYLKEMQVALAHHYKENRHHPEHFEEDAFWQCDICLHKFADMREKGRCNKEIKDGPLLIECGQEIDLGPGGTTKCEGHVTKQYTLRGMNLVDLIEMFCDWLAATKRHADGDIMDSIRVNQHRFGYSDELAAIFRNTAEFLVEE